MNKSAHLVFSNRPIAVLSFSPIKWDRRVIRQCHLLRDVGEQPHVIAYADIGESIPFPLTSRPAPRPTTFHRAKTLACQLPAYLGNYAARAGFWAQLRYRWALLELNRICPRAIIANDWPALVVAAAYKKRCMVPVHYDSHEFAPLEFDERLFWRLVYKPFVERLERRAILYANSISTVGPGIADALQTYYRLATRPAIVRNTPDRIQLPDYVETRWPLRILYHGQILPDRGIDTLLSSMPLWKEAHTLTIRGNGSPAYINQLKALAASNSLSDRVAFEPAVLPEQVMPLASTTADLGVHFTPLDTSQRHFSLPNKFFEYIGSGLAVAVSPGADLRAIVEEYGVGVVSADAGPEAVAGAINELSLDKVAEFKSAARNAAQKLCWNQERDALYDVLAPLISSVE